MTPTRAPGRDELPKRTLYQLGTLLTLSKPSSQEPLLAFLSGDPAAKLGGGDDVDEITDDESEPVDLYDELRAQT